MNPPAGSENLLEPAGPTNPTVSFLSVREPGGRPIAIYASYGLHYVGGVGDGEDAAEGGGELEAKAGLDVVRAGAAAG